MTKATVILFKPSGKYYTEEEWTVPEGAIGPYDRVRSPDFRQISGGAVLCCAGGDARAVGFPVFDLG